MNESIKWTVDKEHVFIDGKQFISLKRFHEGLNELRCNNQTLDEENKRMFKENEALKESIKILSRDK